MRDKSACQSRLHLRRLMRIVIETVIACAWMNVTSIQSMDEETERERRWSSAYTIIIPIIVILDMYFSL